MRPFWIDIQQILSSIIPFIIIIAVTIVIYASANIAHLIWQLNRLIRRNRNHSNEITEGMSSEKTCYETTPSEDDDLNGKPDKDECRQIN